MPTHDQAADRQPQVRVRLTDSPWFWLVVFANAALIGVAAIGPKYSLRQGAVERRYEARREVARRALALSANDPASNETASTGAEGNVTMPGENAPLETSAHIVPLLPLALALIVGNLLAIVLFAWNHTRLLRSAAQNSHPSRP